MTPWTEAGSGDSGSITSITSRTAAHETLTRFFRLHDRTPPRSAIARFFGRDMLTTLSRPLWADVRAELGIARALTRLDDTWTTLHAVPMVARDSDIDHLLIGPGGIFALTVANHSDQSIRVADGAFEVAGSRHHHIRDSEFEVGCIERLLGAALRMPVKATGVVVVIDPRRIEVHSAPRDVSVVSSRELVSWLQSRPTCLSKADVDGFVRAAACPATWMNGAIPEGSEIDLPARFVDVDRAARTADIIRRLWIVTTITSVTAAFSLWAWALVIVEWTTETGL